MSFVDALSMNATQEREIEIVRREADMPVSHTQRRLWFLKQLDPKTYAYNVPLVLRVNGHLDRSAIERVFAELVARHEVLRTRFISLDGSPRCIVEAQPEAAVEFLDLGQSSDFREEVAISHVIEFAQRPFDLSMAPLCRTKLIRLAEKEYLLCFVVDHIVADGLSMAIFVTEFQSLYRLQTAHEGRPLDPLPVQYLDYVQWERNRFEQGVLEPHIKYWKDKLAGLPALLQLPTDRPRPPVQTSNGARLIEQLPPEFSARVKALARSQRATPFIVMLAAFQVLMHRYSGMSDIAVGTAVANRGHSEVEGVMGFFANNIVLRSDLSGNPTVREAISRVRNVAMDAYAHEELPFDMLVDALSSRRELGHSPLFQVLFVLHQVKITKVVLADFSSEAIQFPFSAARFDLAADVFDTPEGFKLFFEYNTDLFNASTIDAMLRHYVRLLERFVDAPNAGIDDLDMMSASEVQSIINDWNRTEQSYPQVQTVHGLFEQQAALRPTAEAVRFGDAALTYEQLNERANQIARVLRSLGVDRGSLVGIEVERSIDMVAGLLAVLKAGAGYVPMDPAFPRDRIDFMARDASVSVILSHTALSAIVPSGSWNILYVDRESERIAAQPGGNLDPVARADDLAYVIYTSGSTGQPKGVEIEHRSVSNFLMSMQRCPGISPTDRLVSVTTLSFDIAALELFGPLSAGGTVVLADRSTALDGGNLIALLEQSRATILQATPATWRLLIDSGWRGVPGLKMLCGGEALPRELGERLLGLGGELWNMYGPTETTIWSTLCKIDELTRGVLIGSPIANTRVYVLEPSGLPAPVGVAGELCIAGDGLARGYRNRPELTAERFVTVTLPNGRSERIYRTGDMARFRNDGRLEFIGRRDHQVKVRGYRIELEEIEAVLATHAGVNECVVVARGAADDQRLVGYVVMKAGVSFDVDAARATLRTKLPDYMVPNQFMVLPALPLTPNSKVDRNALPAPQVAPPSSGVSNAVMTPTQGRIAGVWRSVLGLERVGLRDNFFDVGGHSLLLVKLHVQLKREFEAEFPLVELFQRTTIAAQGNLFSSDKSADAVLKRARARAMRQAHG